MQRGFDDSMAAECVSILADMCITTNVHTTTHSHNTRKVQRTTGRASFLLVSIHVLCCVCV